MEYRKYIKKNKDVLAPIEEYVTRLAGLDLIESVADDLLIKKDAMKIKKLFTGIRKRILIREVAER